MPSTLQRRAGMVMRFRPDSNPETVENGQPAKDFIGDGAKIGETYHTKSRKTGEAIQLHVAPERTQKWIDAFAKMAGKGVNVPVCKDHRVDFDHTIGQVLELKRDGDWIKPKFRVRGRANIDAMANNYISLGLSPKYQDGTGETHDEAMWHLAVTPIPVVSGQQSPIEASRDGEPEEDVFLSLEPVTPQPAPATPAPQRSPTMTPEQRQALIALTAAPSDATDDVLLSRAIDYSQKAQRDIAAVHKYRDDLDAWKKNEEIELSRRINDLEEREIELSRGGGTSDDPREILLSRQGGSEVMHERQLRAADKFDQLIGRGYSPTDVAKLKKALIGDAEQPNVYLLSREPGASDCTAIAVADVLIEVKPGAPAPGEKMPRIDMSRYMPAGSPSDTPIPTSPIHNPWNNHKVDPNTFGTSTAQA